MGHSRHVGTPSWPTLAPDGRVHPSKNVLLVAFVVGTLLLLAVGVLAPVSDVAVPTARPLSTAVLAFVLVLTAAVYLGTRRLEYVVSTRRAYRTVGSTSKSVAAVELDDVADVRVVQSG